ncbi:MAG: DUF504 domain-containing protein [Syntrophobacteraceae bacterium]|nr:DUF504 domain-containing protein [Syntrophobacteraceae bacterium]
MLPIRELLSRIRWDPALGSSAFEIGYVDHLRRETVRIPFRSMRMEPGNRFFFDMEDEDGNIRSIPLHGIREVYRDGALIWKRTSPMEAEAP